ncbi:hypothetical protein SKAU_G00340660 [Synaphobranchus kaupii]|uniref:Uncharacterized protein n=1 Tax=Synaphobranchus kaupii TaxID=118154 RepID=A0A9Q1IIH3_SYNKA|nr:hypothetical protein SKAU_G00340660 [Synaphobranchus kaupii]
MSHLHGASCQTSVSVGEICAGVFRRPLVSPQQSKRRVATSANGKQQSDPEIVKKIKHQGQSQCLTSSQNHEPPLLSFVWRSTARKINMENTAPALSSLQQHALCCLRIKYRIFWMWSKYSTTVRGDYLETVFTMVCQQKTLIPVLWSIVYLHSSIVKEQQQHSMYKLTGT